MIGQEIRVRRPLLVVALMLTVLIVGAQFGRLGWSQEQRERVYKVVKVTNLDLEVIQDTLNREVKDGWSLVAAPAVPTESILGVVFLIFEKRPAGP
jgi:hypothetical protein